MSFLGRQHCFAHANIEGSDLHQFIGTDKADCLFQGQWLDGRENDIIVFSGRPHIGQFLFFAGIHIDVFAPVMLTDNHSFVDRFTGQNEKPSTGFEVEQGIGYPRSGPVCNKGSGESAGTISPVFTVSIKNRVQDTGATSIGEELIPVADQGPRWDGKFKTYTAGAVIDQVDHGFGKIMTMS